MDLDQQRRYVEKSMNGFHINSAKQSKKKLKERLGTSMSPRDPTITNFSTIDETNIYQFNNSPMKKIYEH